jgi:hypothetical protein
MNETEEWSVLTDKNIPSSPISHAVFSKQDLSHMLRNLNMLPFFLGHFLFVAFSKKLVALCTQM